MVARAPALDFRAAALPIFAFSSEANWALGQLSPVLSPSCVLRPLGLQRWECYTHLPRSRRINTQGTPAGEIACKHFLISLAELP